MARTRKTIEVSEALRFANDMLADSVDDAREGRIAIAVYIEHLLMSTGNYRGFRFTDGADGDVDDTRRQYYAPVLRFADLRAVTA